MRTTKITCTRLVRFDAGHRVLGHEGKCARPHGHGYTVELEAAYKQNVTGANLDNIGRVVDFSVLKSRVGGWIEEEWDHGFLVAGDDVQLLSAMRDDWKAFVLPYNPTAENLAKYLVEEVGPRVLADTDVVLVHVRVWETPNCYADARARR